MSNLSNLLIPAVLFFMLGFFARIIRSDLHFPPDLAKALPIYLLIAIGLHGGYEIGNAKLIPVLNATFWAIMMGLLLPVLGYYVLVFSRKVNALNAAAIAAHYGSVSVGTFITARAYLDSNGIPYEMDTVIMLAVMESPAIIVGLLLAAWSRYKLGIITNDVNAAGTGGRAGSILREAFLNGSVVLLVGSMLIGAVAAPKSLEALNPFMKEVFMGALCLFLLEMGMEAARRIGEGRTVGLVLVAFGVVMPLVGGLVGALVGHAALGFGVGGTTLVAVLAASASYIAVPSVMRLAIPEANPSIYLTLSLGITFPFNVIFGIPLYHRLAQAIIGV